MVAHLIGALPDYSETRLRGIPLDHIIAANAATI